MPKIAIGYHTNSAQCLVRMTEGTASALENVAERYGMKRAQVIREMLKHCLDKIEEPIIEPEVNAHCLHDDLAGKKSHV